MNILRKDQYKRSTWKNGLGFTDEIAIYPSNAQLSQGNFLWRLSSAQIEKASPFSLFPHHDRMLIVIKGNGIKLIHQLEVGDDEDVVTIPIHEPYEFPGDIQSRCELPNGPITDLSIFLRRGEIEPMVDIMVIDNNSTYEWLTEGKWNFAFCINGSFQTPNGILTEGNTLSTELKESIAFKSTEQNSRLLLISLA